MSALHVHFFDGFLPSGGKTRAVCHCGEMTTPRVDQVHALRALQEEHGWSSPVCALCGLDHAHDAQMLGGALTFFDVVEVPAPPPGEPIEFFACRDQTSCSSRARDRQVVLDLRDISSAPRTTRGRPHRAAGGPTLRLIRGGKDTTS